MCDDSTLFQNFDQSYTHILRCMFFGVGNDDIDIARLRFSSTVTRISKAKGGNLPSTNLIDCSSCDFLTGVSYDLTDFLNFRSRYFMFVEFFPILDSDLLNSRETIPSTFDNVIQTSPSFIKIPLSRRMCSTAPYSPEQFQRLKLAAVLEMSVFCDRSSAEIIFEQRDYFRSASRKFGNVRVGSEFVRVCFKSGD